MLTGHAPLMLGVVETVPIERSAVGARETKIPLAGPAQEVAGERDVAFAVR